jgi:hypothetical protein
MKKTLIALSILAGALLNVQAAPEYSDNFDYADGGIVANSSGAWVNNTGIAGSMLTTNNQLVICSSSVRTEDIAHRFSTIYTTNGAVTALYASFKLNCTNAPASAGTYFTHFSGTNGYGTLSGFRARVWLSTSNLSGAAPAGKFFLAIANSGLGNATNSPWATALDVGTTYTVVTKYELASGISTLWVDPTSESDTHVIATDTIPYGDFGANGLAVNGPVDISHYSFRQATGEGTNYVDVLKIGTAFADVAGANTAPSITAIANQSIAMNASAGPLSFTIGDSESPASSLALSNETSNATLITTNNIVFGGSGANRTVTLTPQTGQQGSATITIYVSDGVNLVSTSFLLTVGAPTISSIPNQITSMNTPTAAISFTVGDAETGAASVTLSNSFTNPSLISSVSTSGSGATRTVTVTPATGQTGVSTITVYARDPQNNLVQTSFVLSVSPSLGVLLSDDFSYTEFLQGTALVGATGSPWGSASGTLYDLLVINGAAQLSTNATEDVGAVLSGGPFSSSSGVVLYSGFTIMVTNLPTVAGDYIALFKDTITGTTFRAKLYACRTGAAAGKFRIGIANSANTVSITYPADLNTNQTYLVVSRYNTGTGESVLWVNPSAETDTSVAAQDTLGTSSVGAYGLRQSSGIGVSFLDNLKIGTSFSAVLTAVSLSPIPLFIQLNGTNAVLTWSGSAFFLQSSTNIQGTYNTIPGAASPYTVPATNSHLFFRLINVPPGG